MAKTSLSWQAPEFRHYPKTSTWYVILIILSLAAIGFFVFFEKDIFAGFCLAIITVLIVIFSRQTPEVVDIEITEKGIQFGKLFYPYKQLKFFWVVSNETHQTVNFYTSAYINNTLILELGDQDPEEVHDLLIKFLPEHPQTEETLGQRIMHKFKF